MSTLTMHIHPDSELGITLVNIDRITTLRRLDERTGPTDVVSFPIDELVPGTPEALSGPGMLGDIVICPEFAQAMPPLPSAAWTNTCSSLPSTVCFICWDTTTRRKRNTRECSPCKTNYWIAGVQHDESLAGVDRHCVDRRVGAADCR